MYILIDNYDSFVYNLASYFEELRQSIIVVKNDAISIDEISSMNPEGIILSPGPKTPQSAGISIAIVKKFHNRIPILGVCLGHQIIGYSAGASIVKGLRPMHGKITQIRNSQKRLFEGLPQHYEVTRYHSLVVKRDSIPTEYVIDAVSQEGEVMAISHYKAPVYGIQFHPEALLTEYGHELIGNFINICQNRRYSIDE